MTEQHFNFVGADADYESHVSLRIDFGGPICRHRLDVCLEELYLQRRLDPEYLFMSANDYKAIAQSVIEGTNVRWSGVGSMISDIGLVRYVNQTTGRLMYFVVLPGLKVGTVILGFFR